MTVLTGSANFFKYLLFVVNFFFVITGIIILSIGATVQGVYHGYSHILDPQFLSVPNLLIAIGAIIFIVSFFGCCGAYKENTCMIITFTVLLILIFILELAAGISGYVLRNETRELLSQNLNDSMKHMTDNDSNIPILWSDIQQGFSCCGIERNEDWIQEINAIPLSCCHIPAGTLNNFTCDLNSEFIFKHGCLKTFGDYIKAHAVSLGAAGLVLSLIQLFGIFITIYIARQLRMLSGHSSF